MKTNLSARTLVLAFVIGFPILSIALLFTFLSISSSFEVPDFVYIDYGNTSTREEYVLTNGEFQTQPSLDYQRCLQGEYSLPEECERSYQPLDQVTLYRFQNGTSSPIDSEELLALTVTEALSHPTQGTTFGSARCSGPDLIGVDSYGRSAQKCTLSIQKSSWQSKGVSINTFPNLENNTVGYGTPRNIYWITE